MVEDFKFLTGVIVWLQENIPPNAPKFEHFVDLGILLAGIRQTVVISEEFWNKEVHSGRVKRLAKQYVVVTPFKGHFQRTWFCLMIIIIFQG